MDAFAEAARGIRLSAYDLSKDIQSLIDRLTETKDTVDAIREYVATTLNDGDLSGVDIEERCELPSNRLLFGG